MSDISAALCVVITVSTNTAHLCNILYTMGPLTLCSNFDLTLTLILILISINNYRRNDWNLLKLLLNCYSTVPTFQVLCFKQTYVFWLGSSMCYAARVQILLASVDIRISTETYLAARPITSHNITLGLQFTSAAVSTVEIKLSNDEQYSLSISLWKPTNIYMKSDTNWRSFKC